MPKEMMIGNLTAQEQAKMQGFNAEYQQIMMNRAMVDNQLVQYGIRIGKFLYQVEKKHGWDHDAAYNYLPNGEVHKVIPDQPPIAGNHLEEVKEEEVN